jgi:hypothetical protein
MGIGVIPEGLARRDVPVDLVDWVGGDRLIHEVLEAVQGEATSVLEVQYVAGGERYRFQMILTLLVYAYARGVFDSSEIESRCLTEEDFRYLATPNCPGPQILRMFRRRERSQVQSALGRLFQAIHQRLGDSGAIDADAEAARRLEAAIAADNLALDY